MQNKHYFPYAILPNQNTYILHLSIPMHDSVLPNINLSQALYTRIIAAMITHVACCMLCDPDLQYMDTSS